MSDYPNLRSAMRDSPRAWLVSGAAGFIGSALVEALLELDQVVVGIDNLSTGSMPRLDAVRDRLGAVAWSRFRFEEMDIRDADACHAPCEGVAFVLHQAAMTSVEQSLKDPKAAHENNVDGFLNLARAAQAGGVERVVYASSASVYGQGSEFALAESDRATPISPYGATKSLNEAHAAQLGAEKGPDFVGLRYFNVVGPGQDPTGAYAAVVARWTHALLEGRPVEIYGDGETTRDFCSLSDVVHANLLASKTREAAGEVFNIGSGQPTRLIDLYRILVKLVSAQGLISAGSESLFRAFRAGDIPRSLANIEKARQVLGYAPQESLEAVLSHVVRAAGADAARL